MDQSLCNMGLSCVLRAFQLLLGGNYLVGKQMMWLVVSRSEVSTFVSSALPQAVPEAAAYVFCLCHHAEFIVSLVGHHRAHRAQPPARDPSGRLPQALHPIYSAGSAY